MRRVRDDDGRVWDVVLGRASWGVFQALFVPGEGGRAEIRTAVLPDESRAAAERRLQELDRTELIALLAGARHGDAPDPGGRTD